MSSLSNEPGPPHIDAFIGREFDGLALIWRHGEELSGQGKVVGALAVGEAVGSPVVEDEELDPGELVDQP